MWPLRLEMSSEHIFTPVLLPVVVCGCLFRGLYLYDLFSGEVGPGRPLRCHNPVGAAIQSLRSSRKVAPVLTFQQCLSNINFNGFQMNRRTKAKGSRVHDIIFFFSNL